MSTSSPASPAPRARTAASSTPRSASMRCLVDMLAPYKGRVYDPCNGSGGIFVQTREIRRGPRRQARRHHHLRPGDRTHHLEARPHEPRHPRHRGRSRPRARRHLPPRPPPRPQGRLHPRQLPLQRQRLVPQGRRRALAIRPAAQGQRQLRLDPAHRPPPRAPTAWPASSSPMAACPPTSPAKATSAAPSSRPTSWTAWSPSPASSSTAPRSPSASGSSRKTKAPTPNAASATAASKPSSSTPANSAPSSTASTAS